MANQMLMKFWRDQFTGSACLEYAWIPEGKRHTILLEPGQQEGSRTDPISDKLDPSHVNVFRLDNNSKVSTQMWMFPPGQPPQTARVDGATVKVYEQRLEAVGSVHYSNDTSASDTHPLDRRSRKCPELPSAGKRHQKTPLILIYELAKCCIAEM